MKKIFALFVFLGLSITGYSEDLSLGILGWKKSEEGDYKAALELFKKCIETGNLTKPSLARTYRNMGITLRRDSQLKLSIEYFDKAIALEPADVYMDYTNRGNSYSDMNDFENALLDYEKAQKIKPDFNEAYYNRGIVYERQNKIKEAKEQFILAYKFELRSQLLAQRFNAYSLMVNEAGEITEFVVPMEAPKGYTWAKCSEIKAAFLCPEKWSFVCGSQSESFLVFITKENFEANNSFKTGLKIKLTRSFDKINSISPYKYSLEIKESARKKIKFIDEWDKNMGPFKSVGFLYEKKDTEGIFTIHHLMISNEKTGAIYEVDFIAPSNEWAETWKIAEPMLKFLYIDDKI